MLKIFKSISTPAFYFTALKKIKYAKKFLHIRLKNLEDLVNVYGVKHDLKFVTLSSN